MRLSKRYSKQELISIEVPSMADTIEIFISYSHKDKKLKDQLLNHLKPLEIQGLSFSWNDQMIGAGTDWKRDILYHLKTAQTILLLISADFIASDYCHCVEVKEAMQRHEAGEAKVIPIILREAYWKLMPFGKLSALPADDKPVTSRKHWQTNDEAFLVVTERIY